MLPRPMLAQALHRRFTDVPNVLQRRPHPKEECKGPVGASDSAAMVKRIDHASVNYGNVAFD